MEPNPANPKQPKRVLIVDDEPPVAYVLQAMLQALGFDASVLSDPTKALQVALELQPALILLDFDMPRLTGPEVAVLMAANPKLKDIPIVFLSGFADLDHRTIGLASGAVEYIAKPIDRKALALTLKRVMPGC